MSAPIVNAWTRQPRKDIYPYDYPVNGDSHTQDGVAGQLWERVSMPVTIIVDSFDDYI